jgi:antirestriction protein ArdC
MQNLGSNTLQNALPDSKTVHPSSSEKTYNEETSPFSSKNKDDYTTQTANFFISAIENGTAPWQKSWKADEYLSPYNPITKTQYSGMNSLLLEMYSQINHQSDDPRWMTFLNARDNKYHIKKGSKGVPLAYYNRIMLDENGKRTDNPDEAKSYKSIRNFFIVFHASQIEGLPPFQKNTEIVRKDSEVIPNAQYLMDNTKAKIIHDQRDKNYYSPNEDTIHLTKKHTYEKIDNYYQTAFHELSHWTGHETRLNRSFSNTKGSPDYASEELRAEIASYLICKDLKLDFDPLSSASYVASWASTLKFNSDHNEIIKACHDADKIKEYIHDFSYTPQKNQTDNKAAKKGVSHNA